MVSEKIRKFGKRILMLSCCGLVGYGGFHSHKEAERNVNDSLVGRLIPEIISTPNILRKMVDGRIEYVIDDREPKDKRGLYGTRIVDVKPFGELSKGDGITLSACLPHDLRMDDGSNFCFVFSEWVAPKFFGLAIDVRESQIAYPEQSGFIRTFYLGEHVKDAILDSIRARLKQNEASRGY